jgi:predicted RNA-binding Zn-ribbon protein involved in translation (DUF1610 family)
VRIRADAFVNAGSTFQQITQAAGPPWLLIFGASAVPVLVLGGWLLARMWLRPALASAVDNRPAGPRQEVSPAAQSIAFPCPDCGTRLKARADLAGNRIKCPKCTHAIQIPSKPQPEGLA